MSFLNFEKIKTHFNAKNNIKKKMRKNNFLKLHTNEFESRFFKINNTILIIALYEKKSKFFEIVQNVEFFVEITKINFLIKKFISVKSFVNLFFIYLSI